MKRLITLLLAILMVVGVFAACGKADPTEPPATHTSIQKLPPPDLSGSGSCLLVTY